MKSLMSFHSKYTKVRNEGNFLNIKMALTKKQQNKQARTLRSWSDRGSPFSMFLLFIALGVLAGRLEHATAKPPVLERGSLVAAMQ